jgi:hypothetical protein
VLECVSRASPVLLQNKQDIINLHRIRKVGILSSAAGVAKPAAC